MEYQTIYQAVPPYTNRQAIQMPQLNPTYVGDFSYPESNVPYFPNHQPSFHPTSSSVVSDNRLEGYTWTTQDTALALASLAEADPVDPLPREQPAVEMQNAVIERREGDQGLGQAAASVEARLCRLEDRISQLESRCGCFEDRIGRLEDKLGGFEELMQNLRNEIENKTRFFKEVEAYNEKLVAWSRDSREAVDGLVAKLKEEVELAKSR